MAFKGLKAAPAKNAEARGGGEDAIVLMDDKAAANVGVGCVEKTVVQLPL